MASIDLIPSVFEEEWGLARDRVLNAWEQEQATPVNGKKACVRRVVELTGVSRKDVDRMLKGSAPPAQGRPPALSTTDKHWLMEQVELGTCNTDGQYQSLFRDTSGKTASISSIQRFLKENTAFKQVDYSSADKWTTRNYFRLKGFEQVMAGVERKRIRFYDQTGFSMMDLMPKRLRVKEVPGSKDKAPPRKRTTPSSASQHVSVFGVTSIDCSVPALYTKFYKSSAQNGQGTTEHVDFFISAVEDGVLRPGDVVVLDNWSGHKSKIGTELRSILREYGIAMIYLPAKFSHLNSVEHCWRTAKSYARRAHLEFPKFGAEVLMRSGCDSITHEEILRYMIHDGYGVEDDTVCEVQGNTSYTPRPSHAKKRKHL